MMFAIPRVYLVLVACVAASHVEVNTTAGPIVGTNKGFLTGACASFYGVPYAAPPVGQNRFKPPQPVQRWTEPRSAFKVGASCLQTFGDGFVNVPLAVEKIFEKTHIGMDTISEDCLFLNVFTPKVEVAAKNTGSPVMVWFHGGSYLGGSGDKQSGIPFYDGHDMCKTGDVVVVTVNYRLGIFGFFAHNELLKEGGTAGNMGIQDQRAALQWVQENAHLFGGDATRVTIFGESAGAGSVVNHLLSPRSAPLFSAGIMQSGGLWLSSLEESEALSGRLAKGVGCDPSQPGALECMRRLNATDLLYQQLQQSWTMANPCADGYEQPRGATQAALLKAGNFTPKPMIVGTNLNETALFECLSVPANMDEAGFRQQAASQLHIPTSGQQMNKLVSLYNASAYDGYWKRAYIDLATDTSFYCSSRDVLAATVKSKQPAFQYLLKHTVYFFDELKCLGVPHMTDLFYLFGNFNPILKQPERDLGLRMRKHWTQFAYSHDPGAGWPDYSAQEEFLALDTPEDTVGQKWKKDQCDFLASLPSASPMLRQGVAAAEEIVV